MQQSENKIFLSYTLSNETPLYGNEGTIKFTKDRSISKGDSCNTMHWYLPNHSGTHIDAPKHFDPNGKSISDYSPDFWIFNKIEMIDISNRIEDCLLIDNAIFPKFKIADPELLLIKTGCGKHRGTEKYIFQSPGISEKVAFWLRKFYPTIRSIGVDLISVSSCYHKIEGRKTHHAFLNPESGSPILIIEDVKLDAVKRLEKVIVIPFRVNGADGAPCTIIGFSENI